MMEAYADCNDCKRLISKYGRGSLNFCENCGHYYKGNTCSCDISWQDKYKLKKVV
jgi:hypothetical protein